MNLYHISQTENNDYDTYDSAVACAPDEETARNMNPDGGKPMTVAQWTSDWSSWCSSPDKVTVKFLGVAAPSVEPGIVCASYNAG